MRIVDFHNHFYPPEYLRAIQENPAATRVTFDSEGNPLLHYPGDYNVVVAGHRDIQYRDEVLAEAEIDTQVLTFTSPGTHFEAPELAVRLAAMVNGAFALIVRERPRRFSALATLPLNDPEASVREFEKAIDEWGFPGAMLFSNVNGTALNDPSFLPLYEAADARGAILYIHPIHPVGVEAMTDFWLMPLLGFTFDTTLAAAKLVFSGIPERFPRIRWVLAHLGGTIPYLAERLDRGFESFPDCRTHIEREPSSYLKEFYYDTVNFDPACLKLALDFAGADRLLAGSDYPHQIGSLNKMKQSLMELDIPESDREKILGRNAAGLLGLSS